MLVETEDGPIKWNYAKFYSRKSREDKSKYHLEARNILTKIFPNSTLYEEVSLPTKPITYADFFIPDYLAVIEIHGEQHYTFNSHFFESKLDFYKAQARDRKKRDWCLLNEFTFIELSYKERDQWENQILHQFQ